MSHRAVNWALEQTNLKPGPWVVLIKLADRHNKDTLRVDPEQSLLASDCNMGRSSVNRHLDDLEAMGLLIRVPRVHPKTQKQLSTFYVLELDFKNPPDIEFAVSDYETRIGEVLNGNIEGGRVPNSDTVAVSQKSPIPCPKKRDSRVPKRDTNHVKEPVKEPCAAHTQDFDFEDFVRRFEAAYPRIGDLEATRAELRRAVDFGADPAKILAGAKLYASEQHGNKRQYIAYSENWLRDDRWRAYDAAPKASTSESDILEFKAQAIKEKKPGTARHTTAAEARDLIARQLVTLDQCRAAGIAI